MLDDYTKAEFPLDVRWRNGTSKVRLFAAMGGRVIGASFTERTDEEGNVVGENFGIALDFDGLGRFGSEPGTHPDMDLPPPPALVAAKIAELEDLIASAQGRLDGMPDAPQEWRAIDEKAIAAASAKIAILRGD